MFDVSLMQNGVFDQLDFHMIEKEKEIFEELSKHTKINYSNLRDIVTKPQFVGTWIARGESGLFSGITLDEDHGLVMDMYGFAKTKGPKMDGPSVDFIKKYIVAKNIAEKKTMIYAPSETAFGDITCQGKPIGNYAVKKFDAKSDAYIIPLLYELYFKNIRDLRLEWDTL